MSNSTCACPGCMVRGQIRRKVRKAVLSCIDLVPDRVMPEGMMETRTTIVVYHCLEALAEFGFENDADFRTMLAVLLKADQDIQEPCFTQVN